jgi:endoglucanase
VDYLTASGTLTFGPDETSKPVAAVCADGLVEPSEAFTVALSNPTGGSGLGCHATGSVTIEADGEKQNEASFEATDVTVKRAGR